MNEDHCPNCYPLGCECSDAQRPSLDERYQEQGCSAPGCSYRGEACPVHFE